MADVVPFVVMSVKDPRLASFSLDAPERCWVLCEVDPTGKVARVVNWDGGEPEDQLLVRDWSWVPDVLNQERAARDIECDTLRTTLARLTADLAAVTAERDMWRGECESISAELDLPPGMRPMEGELRRMLDHSRTLLAQVTTLTAERDEARGLLREAKNALRDCGELVAFVGCTRTDDNETPTDLDAFPCSADDSPVRSKPDEWCEACEASDSIAQVIHGHSVRGPAHLGRSE